MSRQRRLRVPVERHPVRSPRGGMTGRRRSAILGMLFGYTSLLIALARNVLFVPIYLHNIPLAEYGAWLATGGALALILVNDFGLSGVVTEKISMSYGAGDI